MNEDIDSNKYSENSTNNQSSQKNKLFSSFFSRIKRIKHLDIILTILFIAIILLIYFSSLSPRKENAFPNNNIGQVENSIINNGDKFFTLEDYAIYVESKLQNALKKIKNAGDVCVFVKFENEIENILAYTTTIETKEDGTKVETKSPILSSSSSENQPIVLSQKLPLPSNVVIIATGASNTNVKLEIVRVVQALYNLPSMKIEVFAGN